ncbi:hypothetical protein K470DRAFT_260289 [Piedraia hortae CBS 480.64]|uniref:Uncharacterized protein n=1 Tax=Piedraia hortae CBS 480.64 TaxID=1314780 RepID=A0A6A7BT93_9PEZI|nr:hypothetical protein K470DRAFT_260289 [Piedraia hortae CBS 480.64]
MPCYRIIRQFWRISKTFRPAQWQRHYVTIPKHIKRRKAREALAIEAAQHKVLLDAKFASQLEDACAANDILGVIRLFSEKPRCEALNEFSNVAKCLTSSYRRLRKFDPKERTSIQPDTLSKFAKQLVQLVEKRKMPPDRFAHARLLNFFEESGDYDTGIKFWHWLEKQDDAFVGENVYGAAIELLSTSGASLEKAEALFERALQRFPGAFHAYHLSPNAILADRNARVKLKGISMSLLHAILKARLLRGDSMKAYMALDTALRLFPTITPASFFESVILERPLPEAYPVFALACRAGISLPPSTLKMIITLLRDRLDWGTMSQKLLVLRHMLMLAKISARSTAKFSSNHLNEVIISLTQILRQDNITPLPAEKKQQIASAVQGVIKKTLSYFATSCGVKPGLSAFNAIISNVGGYGQSPELIPAALSDLKSLDLEPSHVTRRSLLTAAGELRDTEMVKRYWHDLKKAQGRRLEPGDIAAMILAAGLSGSVKFATRECGFLEGDRKEFYLEKLKEVAELERYNKNVTVELDNGSLSFEDFIREIRSLEHELESEEIDFTQNSIMFLYRPPEGVFLPDEQLRELYDQVTTEISVSKEYSADESEIDESSSIETPQPETIGPSADFKNSEEFSATGIPLGKLRYENWKIINYLLAMAEANDAAFETAVQDAMAKGKMPPSRDSVVQQKDLQPAEEALEQLSSPEIGRSREILRLRGLPV